MSSFDTLTISANSAYLYAMGLSWQPQLMYDGARIFSYHYDGAGAFVPPKYSTAMDTDGVFSAPVAAAGANNEVRGYRWCPALNHMVYKYHTLFGIGGTDSGFPVDHDATKNIPAFPILGANMAGAAVTSDKTWPTALGCLDGTTLVTDTISAQTKILVKQYPFANNIAPTTWSWNVAVAGTQTTCGLSLNNSDVYVISATGGYIHGNYKDATIGTFPGDVLITSTNSHYQHHAAAPAMDGTIALFWADSTTPTTIMCRIRGAGAAGTLGTPFVFLTDRDAAVSFSACTDLGHPSQQVFYYKDSAGDLVTKRLTNGGPGLKTVQLTGLPALFWKQSLQCLPYAMNKFMVRWHESATGDIKVLTHTIAPMPVSTDGVYIASNGFDASGVVPFGKHVVEFGIYSFIVYNGTGGRAWACVYNNSTKAFEFPPEIINAEAHWDIHNLTRPAISDDGYIAFCVGGRIWPGHPDAYSHYKVFLYDFPLDHPSFGMQAFTDTNLPSTGITTGRGYKSLQWTGPILHASTWHQNVMKKRNYNRISWTAPVDIYDFDGLGVGNQSYMDREELGRETVGQKSLCSSAGWWNPLGSGSGAALEVAYFLRLIYDPATRTYTGEDVAGGAVTLPVTEAVVSGDVVCFDGITNVELRHIRMGFCMLADNTPFMSYLVQDWTAPFDSNAMRGRRWTGSGWADSTISTNFPSTIYGNPGWVGYPDKRSVSCFEDDATAGLYVIYSLSDGSGITQLNSRLSADFGATFSAQLQRTTNNKYGSSGSSVDSSVVYNVNASGMTSEVRMLSRLPPPSTVQRYLPPMSGGYSNLGANLQG